MMTQRARHPMDALFAPGGTSLSAGAGHPFLLTGEAVWRVEAGHVDVFSVRVGADGKTGVRRHLVRVGEGEPLFASAAAEGGMALLAVPGPGARLRGVDRARIHGALAAGDPAGLAAVECWVQSLCTGVSRDLPPRRSDDLEPGATVELAEDASVRPVRVAWVRHLAGSSRLLGIEALRLEEGSTVPLAPPAWLAAAGPARVHDAGPPGPEEAWRGMEALHALVLAAAREIDAGAAAQERERIRRRSLLDRTVLARACLRLAGVMEASRRKPPRHSVPLGGDEGEGALLQATRCVGDAMGIEVVAPRPGAAAPGLAAIARSSRFQTRRVMLRGEWWRRDGGPLLAFMAEGGHPVSLVPEGPTRYRLWDPATGAREVVDARVAGTLSPFGYTLYRGFPPTRVGAGEIVRVGGHGLGRDVRTLVAVSAGGGVLAMAIPIATGVVFDSVIPGAERAQLLQITLLLLAVAMATALLRLTQAVALTRIEGRMAAATQSAVWDRLLSLPADFFSARAAGDLATRAFGVDAARQMLSGATMTALVGSVFSLFSYALLFRYSVRLALWATLLTALSFAMTLGVGWVQFRRQRALARLQAEIAGMVLQFLTGISKLRVAAAEAQAFALWAGKFAEQRRLRFGVGRAGALLTSFNTAFPVVTWVVIFAVAADEEGLRTGDFLAFMAALGTFTAAVLSISGAFTTVLSALPLYENARPILHTLPEGGGGKADPGLLAGDIDVEHVCFRYGTDGSPVLNNLSIHAAAGEFVALVGPSGSGKSTLLRLLLGFEQPTSGSIFFDGQELDGLEPAAVRRQMGVVLQNGRLMPGDLFTNIVGSSGATLAEAWEAARMAGFDADIRAMPMGMHTVVSEGMGTLSGGQRQRLMIARAVVTRPRILLFDEATSALDNRTQAIVSESLAHLRATRIVIAHRLSTVVHADRVYVVKHGSVVECGTYDALMAADGEFAALARRQIA